MIGPDKEDGTSFEERRKINPAIGFGTSFAAGMALFGLGGHWLDTKYDKEPLFTLIGIGLGLFYGAYELWKLIQITNCSSEAAEKAENKHKEKSHDSPD